MPRNNNFSLMDSAARPVYPTFGILMSAEGTDQQAEQKPIIGAYYNTLEQDAGLYIPLPSGSFDYFDIDVADVVPQGSDKLVRFDAEGMNYLIRPFYEEDGEWLSKYKIPLPKSVLEKIVTLQSHDAIEKFTGTELGEPLEFFEGLYCYYLRDSNIIMSIVYMSSAGIFSRRDAQWKPEALNPAIYEDAPVFEISIDGAKQLLDSFDSNRNVVSVEDAKKLSVEPE
jgi:hypothetical protein